MLDRIEKTLAEIKSVLLEDEVVRKLLFNDSNNCLNMAAPSKKDVDKYITLHPIYQLTGKEEYEQNGMINIVLSTVENGGDRNIINGVIQINIVFNIDKWDLVGNKIRPIELSNRIINLTNKKKFSISNPIELTIINDLIINKQLVGYALLFDFTDGSSKLENF